MLRHVAFTLLLIAGAIAAGIAMVPREREQWTILVRDNRDEEALKILDARYQAGGRYPYTVLQLYKLQMSFAKIGPATRVIEQFAADRPNDVEAATLLAKHYDDTQNKQGEMRALEHLFDLAPSRKIAGRLLPLYRLSGAFDREERLLQSLLAKDMIIVEDTERLGLLQLARGDLDSARQTLTRLDEVANSNRMIGRLALF